MVPEYVHGVISNVFTCFNEDESLDDAGQRNFLDALMTTKSVSAYFVRSGMGQQYAFEFEDVKQIARNACSHLAGKAPVLVGTSGIWDRNRDRMPDPDRYLSQAVELSRHAQDAGAAGAVLTIPEALTPRDGETPLDATIRYLEAVCDAIDIPVFLYQPPGTDEAFCVTPESIRILADIPQVKGIKISTSDAGYILDICWAVADHEDFAYITGAETAFYAGLCVGSRAVIGQGACVNPAILKAVQDRFEQGNHKGAIDAQRSANMLVDRATDVVEFLKRYFTEKGYPVHPTARTSKSHAYTEKKERLTQEHYDSFKQLLENELAKYAR